MEKVNQESILDKLSHRKRAAWISIVMSFILMILKYWAFQVTGSQSVRSDALESIINVVTSILALFVIVYSAKPADKDHPYGHGKAEYFSAAFEGGLICFAAFFIVIEGIKGIIYGHPLRELDFGILIVFIAGIANLALGLYLISVGRKKGSLALRASGNHVVSDFWTSFGVVLGLGVVKFTGFVMLDSIIAIIIGLLLARTGIKLAMSASDGLMDKEDLSTIKRLEEIFNQIDRDEIIQIHHVKVIRSGDFHHIDAHIVVPEFWDVEKAHNQTEKFEKLILKEYGGAGEIAFHLDPCRKAYCEACALSNCPIRQKEFVQKLPIKLEDLRSPHEPRPFMDPKKESKYIRQD